MIYSYCKKCQRDSLGEVCAGCGRRIPIAAQRDVWSVSSVPASDGRIWRSAFLAVLLAAALLFAVVLGLEAFADGSKVPALLSGPFPRLTAAMVPLGMAVVFLFLALQGREVNVYTLEQKGAHLTTWHAPQKWRSWARLQSADPGKNQKQQDGSIMHRSQDRHIRWEDVQAVQYKQNRSEIFLYHTPHCAPLILKLPADEYELAAAYVNKYCKGK